MEAAKYMSAESRGPEKLGPTAAWGDEYQDSKFFAEYLNRLVTGRDMNIVVTAASETGVGKTTLAVALALLLDQRGWTAEKATVANPAEYDRLYDQVQPGSVLILDEAEKAADSRRGMSGENVTLSQSFAAKRYRQVFSILTAPSKSWIDNRLGSDAADYWIQAQQTDLGRIKGEAKVYRLRTNEHYQTDYTERTERLHWPDVGSHEEFKKLDERKRRLLESDDEKVYYTSDEVSDIVDSRVEEAKKKQRKRLIADLNDHPELTQSEIGDVFGLSASRVSQIANSG